MTYETTNLDEAAYFALQGYKFSVLRTAPVSARFLFSIGNGFEEARVQFWTGCATVQLHKWLSTRAALKNQVYGQAVPTETVGDLKAADTPSIVPNQSNVEVRAGISYWYREKEAVLAAVFGNRNPHTTRLAQGNFYRTREDAALKRSRVRLASAPRIVSEADAKPDCPNR